MFSIKNTKEGICLSLTGFKPQAIKEQIEACQSGNCECACDVKTMGKITAIKVTGAGEQTEITLKGDVKAEESSEMMKECLFGKTE